MIEIEKSLRPDHIQPDDHKQKTLSLKYLILSTNLLQLLHTKLSTLTCIWYHLDHWHQIVGHLLKPFEMIKPLSLATCDLCVYPDISYGGSSTTELSWTNLWNNLVCSFTFSLSKLVTCLIRCPGQLIRWHCQSVSQSVSESLLILAYSEHYDDYNDYND